jgi:glycosyltransferase involved in cell wall biosynthesis
VLQVIVGFARVLNRMGVVPDLLTFRSDVDARDVEALYGANVRFNIKTIPVDLRLPYEWHFLWFNLAARRHLEHYDLIIDQSNTALMSGAKERTLSYVHFPRKARVRSGYRSLHLSEMGHRRLLDVATDPFGVARMLYGLDTNSYAGARVFANSGFTRSALHRSYGLDEDRISVLYPPVDVNVDSDHAKELQWVASLGRFSPEKRQLEQIQIAEQLGQFRFFIMGFGSEGDYFQRCREYVEDRQVSNVELLADLDFVSVSRVLAQSSYFLHSTRDEPFGVTTVMAAAHGCVPIVHDSGGQRETVPFDELRYAGLQEAVAKLAALNTSPAKLEELRAQLKRGIQTFSEEAFDERVTEVLRDILS